MTGINLQVEVWPGVWLELDRSHHLWSKLQLLATDGVLSQEVLETLRRHGALSPQTWLLVNSWAFNVLRPALQHFAEEINK